MSARKRRSTDRPMLRPKSNQERRDQSSSPWPLGSAPRPVRTRGPLPKQEPLRSGNPEVDDWAQLVSLGDKVITFIEGFFIWFFGDPDWKKRTRIQWDRTILFRKRKPPPGE